MVSVAGEIDSDTGRAFRDALTSALAGGVLRLVVDLAAVTYMGSTGIGVLMGVRRCSRPTEGRWCWPARAGKSPRYRR